MRPWTLDLGLPLGSAADREAHLQLPAAREVNNLPIGLGPGVLTQPTRSSVLAGQGTVSLVARADQPPTSGDQGILKVSRGASGRGIQITSRRASRSRCQGVPGLLAFSTVTETFLPPSLCLWT